MSDERRYVDVSGHTVTDVDPFGPTGICPVYGHRVYCHEVTEPEAKA